MRKGSYSVLTIRFQSQTGLSYPVKRIVSTILTEQQDTRSYICTYNARYRAHKNFDKHSQNGSI